MAAAAAAAGKHSVFVGNLTFHTTEDQLRDIFNTVGPTAGIRIVTDKDTGRPKGYAFIQYDDPALALSAIRNLNGVELNQRKLRVSFSSNSEDLRSMAKMLGQDLEEHEQTPATAMKTTEGVVAGLKLHQAYDFLETMKSIVEEDHGRRAKIILETYPQLMPACIDIQRRLGMVNIGVAADQRPTSLSVIDSINTAPSISQSSYQQHLLQQVMQMSDEDLLRLPAESRAQMIMLREKLSKQTPSGGGVSVPSTPTA